MLKPTFSIILPVYNVEEYIEVCVKSILNQTFKEFELICIDDVSQDNSIEIVEKYAENDERIKIFKHETNKGLGAARNTGVKFAKGKYLCCIDSDDWIEESYLENIYSAFQENDVDSVWVKYWRYDEQQDYAFMQPGFPFFYHTPEGRLKITPDNITDFPGFAWNKAYKLDYIKENYFQWLTDVYFEDMYFYYDYFMTYPKVFLLSKMLYYYRQRPASIVTRQDITMQRIRDMFKVHEAINKLIDIKGYDIQFKEALLISINRFCSQFKNKNFYELVKLELNVFTRKIKNNY